MDVDIDDYVMFLAVFEGAFGGAVPNGADEPGIPLTLVKSGTGRITLSWGPSCATDDTDYALYEGTLGDFDSHFRKSCSTGGLTTATITPGTGNRYFLVVPGNGISEGSYGVDGSGNERPAAPAALACRPSYPSVCF